MEGKHPVSRGTNIQRYKGTVCRGTYVLQSLFRRNNKAVCRGTNKLCSGRTNKLCLGRTTKLYAELVSVMYRLML